MGLGADRRGLSPPVSTISSSDFFPFWYDALICPQGTGTIGEETVTDVTGLQGARANQRVQWQKARATVIFHFMLEDYVQVVLRYHSSMQDSSKSSQSIVSHD